MPTFNKGKMVLNVNGKYCCCSDYLKIFKLSGQYWESPSLSITQIKSLAEINGWTIDDNNVLVDLRRNNVCGYIMVTE